MNAQASLFDAPTTAGRVRATDPQTSAESARCVSAGVEEAVLGVFRAVRQIHDDALCDALPNLYPATVKTARSRLSKRGALRATNARRLSNRGRPQIVWVLARGVAS